MVIFDPGPGARAAAFADRVRVVESQQTLAVAIMQGQGLIQAMRLLQCDRDFFHLEPYSKSSLCHKYFTIKHEESIEARIACYLQIIIG